MSSYGFSKQHITHKAVTWNPWGLWKTELSWAAVHGVCCAKEEQEHWLLVVIEAYLTGQDESQKGISKKQEQTILIWYIYFSRNNYFL